MGIRDRRHSLFCALRPPQDLARDLWEEFAWLRPGDDRVEPGRYHVTLVRLGAWTRYPGDVIERVHEACAAVRAGCFRIVFDELIVGDHVLLKPSEIVPALDRFHALLTQALREAGLIGTSGRAFRPHMTASYRSRTRDRIFVAPVSWQVRDFVLIESLVGRRTQIERGRWPLAGR